MKLDFWEGFVSEKAQDSAASELCDLSMAYVNMDWLRPNASAQFESRKRACTSIIFVV
jgi:hypothetical protein